jgi:hypothetical protein
MFRKDAHIQRNVAGIIRRLVSQSGLYSIFIQYSHRAQEFRKDLEQKGAIPVLLKTLDNTRDPQLQCSICTALCRLALLECESL